MTSPTRDQRRGVTSLARLWMTCLTLTLALPATALAGRPMDGSIRLAGAVKPSSGRVEIFFDGEWGTVCDDEWDLADAEVVCRQLGFGRATSALSDAAFGAGTGPIWLDNVSCTGSENRLADCDFPGLGVENCSHLEDAGVICTGADAAVRLVGGANPAEGRVEVINDGEWGTVCDDEWGLADAEVVCHQLGFDGASAAPGDAFFGPGSGPIWMDNVNCAGSESGLTSCDFPGFGDQNCFHSEDAGAICVDDDNEGDVRLADGGPTPQGRVEVFHDGQWGTVCNDLFNQTFANVVCGQLGFAGAEPGQAFFPPGEGPIWMDRVRCTSADTRLVDCSFDGFGVHDCSHADDVGVRCRSERSGALRLVDGASPSEGRLEVLHNGQWGTVCDDGWDIDDAGVVCRQLGFAGAAGSGVSVPFFGQGAGPIWMDDVQCVGFESSLTNCDFPGFGAHDCSHGEDVGVRCNSDPNSGALRLVGGASSSEGRLEVLHNGEWGTVCDDSWDLRDAEVVCRQLGFAGAGEALGSASFGPGAGQIWMDEVNCVGSESSLTSCDFLGFGVNNCDHSEDAGVRCNSGPNGSGPLRLVGGESSSEGRVEILHNGEWGTVCDDRWDLRDADVVCRQLGFASASEALGGAFFGPGSGPIWMDDVNCLGAESSLTSCDFAGFGTNNCPRDHSQDAGVRCSSEPTAAGALRLVDGLSPSEGRLEVFHDGEWGTICSNSWDEADANVACRQLGFGRADRFAGIPVSFGPGTGKIWMDDLSCTGSEGRLTECTFAGFGNNDCSHSEDVGLFCEGAASGCAADGSPFANCGFERGNLEGWLVQDVLGPALNLAARPAGTQLGVSSMPGSLEFFPSRPTEGDWSASHGFSGDPGDILLSQEVTVPIDRTQLTFDYRAYWDLTLQTEERLFAVRVRIPDGEVVLSEVLLRMQPEVFGRTGPVSASIDLSAVGGATVEISFVWTLPEGDERPAISAAFDLDNVNLVPATDPCPGDCDGDGTVSISELIRAVGIALGDSLAECLAADPGSDGAVTIADLIRAVSAALDGCGG